MSFFCKQKTADEMRMSDWISDVCSSDLRLQAGVVVLEIKRTEHRLHLIVHLPQQLAARVGAANLAILVAARLVGEETLGPAVASGHTRRSEERRVGKARVSTGRSWMSPDLLNKNNSLT